MNQPSIEYMKVIIESFMEANGRKKPPVVETLKAASQMLKTMTAVSRLASVLSILTEVAVVVTIGSFFGTYPAEAIVVLLGLKVVLDLPFTNPAMSRMSDRVSKHFAQNILDKLLAKSEPDFTPTPFPQTDFMGSIEKQGPQA